jgi:hypothetical protein
MLVHPNSRNTRCITQLRLTTVLSEVADFPTVVAWVTSRCKLLWWPNCHLLLLLLLYWRSVVVLLLLQAVAPELWWRVTQLSHRWDIDHAVLQGSSARTTSRGS